MLRLSNDTSTKIFSNNVTLSTVHSKDKDVTWQSAKRGAKNDYS